MAARSKYPEYIQPNLAKVEEWASVGVPEATIARRLGVHHDTFIKYKARYPELFEALKKGRQDIVDAAYSALAKRALGYDYEETETHIRKDGKSYVVKRAKHQPPDVAAINLLLKNWARGEWANDPAVLDLKREELELKKRVAEQGNWEGFSAMG